MNTQKKILTGAAIVSLGVAAICTPYVKKFEGLRLHAYLDSVSVPTICYGSTTGVRLGDYKNEAECNQMLAKELKMFEVAINREINVPLPDHTKAALVSFTYNVGIKAFKDSTLLKKLNSGNINGACKEMLRWVYAKGKVLKGLQNRRQAEYELCMDAPA